MNDKQLSIISREGTNPQLHHLIEVTQGDNYTDNISVYDAKADEYYSVTLLCRANKDNDVLDSGHLVLVINTPE